MFWLVVRYGDPVIYLTANPARIIWPFGQNVVNRQVNVVKINCL